MAWFNIFTVPGSRLQRPCLSPRGLPFLLAALPRYHILIMPGWQLRFQCQRDMKTEKPSWLKRRLVWPLKLHILRSLPFKVGAFLLMKAFITWARCRIWCRWRWPMAFYVWLLQVNFHQTCGHEYEYETETTFVTPLVRTWYVFIGAFEQC